MNKTLTKNNDGKWVEAIPEPYYHLIRKECKCGKKFWTMEGYKHHYSYQHIINPILTKHI